MHRDLQIVRVDPFDAASYDSWYDCYAAAERADRGAHAPLWTLEESRSELQQVSDRIDRRAFIARRGDEVVAAAKLGMSLKDNTHRAGLGVYVPAAHRRQGIGSQVLAEVERQATDAGRSTVVAESSWPYRLGPDGAGAPGREFARRHGYALAIGDVMRQLPLPVREVDLDRLAAAAAERHGGYRLRSWSGPVPDEVVAGWAVLDASLETEAPTGELDLQPTTADVAAIREQEALHADQQRTSYGTVAVDHEDNVAAYTQLVVSGQDGNAYQWGTLVRSADRGHRLGLAVKVANLRQLQTSGGAAAAVITYNADSNTHMNAVNEQLGFVPAERLGEFQKRFG
ncbi:GNAT family N-acetyltransferase [Microlunatus soli]|uniref:Acetyltransferase (GNAT) domain-containing protein n=1 Tax=Microlunatus soli TaxID=630515 RepID=A0A1H1WG33_9ACTN|nr:GNAT family N-acetyltransferase [Microlunatus soli]SDS95620.1 Acetyltransferase (GNAT) domain-containing protein [Microlunatus soli]